MSFFLYEYSINFIRCIFKIENSFSRLYIDIYIIFETFNSYFVVTFNLSYSRTNNGRKETL